MEKENKANECCGWWKVVVEASKDAVCVADLDGKILDCNKSMLEFLAKPREEVISRICWQLWGGETELSGNSLFLLVKETLEKQEGIIEIKGCRVGIAVLPVLNDSGNLSASVIMLSDMAGCKSGYDEFLETQSQFFQSAKMGSVGQLAGGVAHELNNPMVGILNNVQLINMRLEKGENFNIADFKEILTDIESCAKRCADITQSLLNFSHLSQGEVQKFSLNELIEEVLSLIENDLKLQNITVRAELNPDIPFILGNTQLIEEIIFEIISNARWAIKKKSGSDAGIISIKTGYETDKKFVFFSIADTGIGISAANLRKVFEPFFTTKEPGEGVGLGLSVIYSVLKSHQGSIEVNSQEGLGSTFKINLPEA